MSPVRKLALRISGAVARWAAPGCKEWAEGLEREVEFIPSDWRTLGWALGSTRVLLERRANPAASRRIFTRWVTPLIWPMQMLIPGLSLRRADCLQEKIAWSLVLCGCVYWWISSVLNWLEDRGAPQGSDAEVLLYDRLRLERRLEWYRSVRRWFPLLASACVCTGLVLALADGSMLGRIFSGFVIAGGLFAIWLQSLESRMAIQSRLERLNALIAESASRGGR